MLLLWIFFNLAITYGTVRPKLQLAYEGAMVKITCNSKKVPGWRKNGKLLSINLMETDVLILPRVQAQDSGIYTCEGIRDSGGAVFLEDAEVLVGGRIN